MGKSSRYHLMVGSGSPSNSTSNLACSCSNALQGWIFLVKTGGVEGFTCPCTIRSWIFPLCSTSVVSVAVIFLVISKSPLISFCVCLCFAVCTSRPWTVDSEGSGGCLPSTLFESISTWVTNWPPLSCLGGAWPGSWGFSCLQIR